MFTLRGGNSEEKESEKMMMLGGETSYHRTPSQQQPLPYSQSFGEEQMEQELIRSNVAFNRQNASAQQEFHLSKNAPAHEKKDKISTHGQSPATRTGQQQLRESAKKHGEIPKEKTHFKLRNFHEALKH